MNLTDQLLGAATFPNLDVSVPLGADLSGSQFRAVTIEVELSGLPPSAPIVPPSRIAGILQNAPPVGTDAIVRIAGWSHVVYGGTVTAGDLLKVEESGAYNRLVTWDMGVDGHTHEVNAFDLPSILVYVSNLGMAPVTGLTGADIVAKQWVLHGGTITELPATTSVTEVGSGWYTVAVTSSLYATELHRLSIDPANPLHVITPAEYQWTPRNKTDGPPSFSTYRYIMGQAISSGVADAIGLMMLRPQLY